MLGARTRECELECERVRACASRGWGPAGAAAGSCAEPEIQLPENQRRGAAVNSRGRSLPGCGGDTTDSDFLSDRRKWINAVGAVGKQELGTLPKVGGRIRCL